MTNGQMTAVAAHQPISIKAACFGFAASTVAMIVIMVVVGNLA